MRSVEKIAQSTKSNIYFLGNIQHDKIYKFLIACDVSCYPSQCNEAAGLSIIEAKYFGKPVITTNRGGIPEYAEKGCIMVNDDDNLVNRIKAAIIELKNDQDYYDRLQNESITERDRYNISEYYEQFVSLVNGWKNEKSDKV